MVTTDIFYSNVGYEGPFFEPDTSCHGFKLHGCMSNFLQRGWINKRAQLFKPTFYPCTVFRQPRPLPEGALSCRCPAADYIVYYRTGWVTGDNSIVYYFYFIAARSTVHAKIDS